MIVDRSSSQPKNNRLGKNVKVSDMKNVKQASKKARERSVTDYNDRILACSTEQPSSPQSADESSERLDPVMHAPGANDQLNEKKGVQDIIPVTNHHNNKDDTPPSSSIIQEVDSLNVLLSVKGNNYDKILRNQFI